MAFQYYEIWVKRIERKEEKAAPPQARKTAAKPEEVSRPTGFWAPATPTTPSQKQVTVASSATTPRPSPKKEERYPTERRIGEVVEKELLHFRSTLYLASKPGKLPGTFKVTGWVRVINPNPVDKTVEFWPEISYAVPAGMGTIIWKAMKTGKVCICGECGDKVKLVIPAKGEKKCNVEMEVEVPDLGDVTDIELDLKAYYKHPKKIPGLGWVEGGTLVTVAGVIITDEYKELRRKEQAQKSSKPTGEGGAGGQGGGTQGKKETGGETGQMPLEQRIREKEKRFWGHVARVI